jgi:hypothetical protein
MNTISIKAKQWTVEWAERWDLELGFRPHCMILAKFQGPLVSVFSSINGQLDQFSKLFLALKFFVYPQNAVTSLHLPAQVQKH